MALCQCCCAREAVLDKPYGHFQIKLCNECHSKMRTLITRTVSPEEWRLMERWDALLMEVVKS